MLAEILAFIVIVYVILLPVYVYLIWNHKYWQKRGMPTAKPLSLIGTYPNIITRGRNFVFDMQDVYQKYKNKYRAIGVFVTRKPEILILDPKLAHDILVTNFSHYHDTISSSWVNDRNADKYVARNPFWSAGEEWKTRRTDLVGGLTLNKLKQSYAIWRNSCLKLRTFLMEKTNLDRAEVETRDLAYRFTADVMTDFIWGIEAATLAKPSESSLIVELTSKWTTSAFNMLGYCYILTIAPFLRYLYPFRFNPKDTDKFFSNLTTDAVTIRTQLSKNERQDFLSHLLMLREKKRITHDDMVGHSLTVLLDGYETTGIALVHTLVYLAKHPEIQMKLREEITKCYIASGGELSYENVMGLPYMDQCVYETLRLIAPIPSFSRICTKPTTISPTPNRIVEIAEGMVVTIPAYCYHHDEDFFPQADEFMPERFNNGAHFDLIRRGIFLPFSDGPRICAGNRLALITIKAALVEILTQYELCKCAANVARKTSAKSFVMTPAGDAVLEFRKIKNANII